MGTPKRKRCASCGKERLAKFFYRRSDTGRLHSWCKDCTKERQDPEKKRQRSRAWRAKHKKRHKENNRKYLERLRVETLTRYSDGDAPACCCCGEDQLKFLSVDHINGGGNADRRRTGKSGVKFYSKLRRDGWPKGFQVLCFNCNMAKGFWGVCPHEEG